MHDAEVNSHQQFQFASRAHLSLVATLSHLDASFPTP